MKKNMHDRWKKALEIYSDAAKHAYGDVSIERYIWYLIYVCIWAFTIYMIYFICTTFMENPTYTTLESFHYPVSELAMPGISVCNLNKISKKRAEAYAEKLAISSGRNKSDIMNNVTLLGHLYDFSLPVDLGTLETFQVFLETYPDNIQSGSFDTQRVLKELTTPCHETLTDCVLHGAFWNCSDLFVTELTMEGFCCVFNYIAQRKTAEFPRILKENNNEAVKIGNGGLNFKIMFNLTDMTYTTMSTLGSKILISLSTDYPDKASGGLSEEIVNIGVESFIRYDAVTTTTTLEVKNYPIEKRKCIFRDEVQTIFGNYSFSDCIMDCKIKSVIALCQCVPFNYFSVFPRSELYDQCTLTDLVCLNSHINKWVRLYPIDYQGDGLDLEKQMSLRCPICTAACSDTLYYIDASSVQLHEAGVENVNFSIVNIELNKYSGMSNIHDASFYWYDMIGIFGGICSLTMGLSFISVVEALFLFIYVICKGFS